MASLESGQGEGVSPKKKTCIASNSNDKVTMATNHQQKHPIEDLQAIAEKLGVPMLDEKFVQHMDDIDPLRELRQDFHYPKNKDLIGSKRFDCNLIW